METSEEKTHYQKPQETELQEEKQFVAKPEPDNIYNDKLQILQEG